MTKINPKLMEALERKSVSIDFDKYHSYQEEKKKQLQEQKRQNKGQSFKIR